MKTAQTHRLRSRRGNAMLEFGLASLILIPMFLGTFQFGYTFYVYNLILPIFIPVLIGILDFGQFLYFHQSLSERARAGARYAAVHTFDATKIANYTLYNDDTGTANGATALLPNVNGPGDSDATKA